MFSQIGRIIDEKYLVLKNKNSILSGQHRTFRVRHTKPKTLQKQPNLVDLQSLEVPVQETKNHKRVMSASFRNQSREEYYHSKVLPTQRRDFQVPPCGNYRINFYSVDR
jgi:hypothetical protein